MRKLAAAVIAALFACQCFALTPARAGTTGVLAGRIVDSATHLALAHAKVAVASPSQSAATETDAGGSFRFLSLAPDTYVLSVTLEGYDTVSQPAVTVQADQSETVDVTLQKTLRTIGKVTRRASGDLIRPGVTSDVYSVNAAAQEAAVGLGGAGGLNSAYGAIASVPGTVVQAAQQGWYQTISIRGGDIDQVGYELDGIPVNRVYDNAPQTMLSSLGQQELQVYTGGTPAGSDGQGLSGYVNQVIKSGTYPGFGTLNASIGGPAFYHKLSFETGGASPNRNFSYYIGLAGANEDYRYVDNFNGASDPRLFYPLYWPEGRYNLYDGTPNSDGTPGTVQFAPGVTYAISNTSQRDTVANFHFALPHKNDGLKDDVQLLYVTSEIVADYFSSINDQGGPAAVANAVGGSGNASWHDGYVYNGPLFSAPDPTQVVPYYFMSSPTNRALNSPYSNDARDTNDNGVATLKLQYQKNFSSRSFARISAYSLYSNWFIHGAANQNFTGYYGAELNDYEIPSHTFGGNFTYSNQLSDKHLLTLTGAYSTTTIQRRYNYGFPGNQTLDTAFTNLIDPATAATTGHCYDTTGALTSCFNGPRGTFADPYDGTSAGFTVATPTGGTAQWIATENGPLGRVNNVSPITTALSLTDNVRASDKVTLNLGVRLENYTDRLADTSGGPNRAFWVKAYNNEFCYRPGVFGAIDIAGSATPDPVTGVFATAANCAALGTGYVPVNFINSNGDGKISSTVTQPRLAFTFAPDGDTVIRGSFGVYSRPVNTSWLQYNDLNDRDWLLYAGSNFAGYGFNTPRHDLQPDTSFNYDLSLEKHLKGTDFSFKATPFYRHTKNQLQAFPIGIGGIVSGFNVGQQTSSGIELALRKGDFARDGLAAQLSYTYTHSRIKYSKFPSGTSVIDSLNEYIQEYNSYTKACATITAANSALCGLAPGTTNPNAQASFAANGGGTVANPYYSQTAQPLMDPNGSYTTYDQIPQVFAGANGYETPNVAALVLQYKRARWTVTPTFSYSSGASYGSPLTYPGYIPNGNCSLDGSGNVLPYTCGGASAISGQSFLMIPDAFTGKFDTLGAFQEPSRFTLNLAIGYEASKNVKATLSLTSLVDKCFQRGYAWDDPNICVYSELPSGGAAVGPSGNFLPLAQTPVQLRYPYGTFNNNLNTGFIGTTLPVQAALNVQIKI